MLSTFMFSMQSVGHDLPQRSAQPQIQIDRSSSSFRHALRLLTVVSKGCMSLADVLACLVIGQLFPFLSTSVGMTMHASSLHKPTLLSAGLDRSHHTRLPRPARWHHRHQLRVPSWTAASGRLLPRVSVQAAASVTELQEAARRSSHSQASTSSSGGSHGSASPQPGASADRGNREQADQDSTSGAKLSAKEVAAQQASKRLLPAAELFEALRHVARQSSRCPEDCKA